MTDVTYHGTVNGTRVALSHMRNRGRGAIVNVCSAMAFHGLPLMSSYAGAKAAVRAFGQAVQGELRLERDSIRIGTVFPPAANTPYFSHALSHMGWPARPARPVYQPEVVAQGIWQAMASGRAEMAIGGTVETFALVTRLAPRLLGWCVGELGFERQLTRDPGACALQEPTLFEPSQRVFRARAVRTGSTEMECTALAGKGPDDDGEPAGPGMAGRHVKRSVASQTRCTRSGSRACRFGSTARRSLEIEAADRSGSGDKAACSGVSAPCSSLRAISARPRQTRPITPPVRTNPVATKPGCTTLATTPVPLRRLAG